MIKSVLFSLSVICSYTSISQTWQDVGGGTNSSSHGMCVWNGKLVDAGSFNNPCQKVATWNGTIWECLGGGVGLVGRAAIEWNGNLVVVGDFWNNFQPCTDCNGIGVWDGTSWSALGTGFNNDVLCLAIWNGDLVAGGDFTEADGLPCSRVARWDGTTWQPIGGPTDFDNDIRCMVEFDGEFWVGGDFNNAGGCGPCDGLAKWDGTAWVGGDAGVDIQGGVDSTVRVLYVNPNDGNLYMGGHFIELNIDGVINTDFNGIAMYDGSVWTPLGTGVDSYVRMIHEYNGNVIVGGDFNNASGTAANKIAKWNPITSSWSAMSTGMNGYVKSGTVYNGTFYAGGDFTTASGLTREYIASWYEAPSVPPVANINSSGSSACAGNCISFSDFSTNSPTGWAWSFPGSSTPTSSAQNPGSICYPTAGTFTVTLEACNGSGCDISTQNITITATPTVSFPNSTICEGESTTLTATPSAGGGTYLWSPGGATTPTITISPMITTNYSVTYTLNGCSSTLFSGTVMVNDTPTLSVTPSSTICSGTTVNLISTPSIAGGNFLWSPGGETTQNISVSPVTTTPYTVSYTLNGCDAADANTTITVNPTPTVSVNSETICDGFNATIIATPSLGGGTYLWSPGGETTSSINVSPSGTTNYSVSYLLNGCNGNVAVSTITVTPQPTVSVNDAAICSGTFVDLIAIPSDGGGSYLWSPGGETTQTISVSPGTLATYTVTYTVNGCLPAETISTVTVSPTPIVTVNNETICAGETAILTATPSDLGGTYLWSPGGEVSSSINVNPTAPTTYSVTYTLGGCESTPANGTVAVNPMPNLLVDELSFSLSAQQNSALYQWLDCEAMTMIAGETNQLFDPGFNGEFAVEINLNGCIDTSLCYVINGIGFAEESAAEFLIYPNPATNEITVVLNQEYVGSTYFVYDIYGRVVLSGFIDNSIVVVELDSIASGVYFINSSAQPNTKMRFVKN